MKRSRLTPEQVEAIEQKALAEARAETTRVKQEALNRVLSDWRVPVTESTRF